MNITKIYCLPLKIGCECWVQHLQMSDMGNSPFYAERDYGELTFSGKIEELGQFKKYVQSEI